MSKDSNDGKTSTGPTSATSDHASMGPRPKSRDVSLEFMEVSWQGPIPPPQVLKQYDDIIPNGAERLFAQFENETAHRHLRERRAQNHPLYDQLAARAVALVFALACLGVAAHAINNNQPWVAAAFGAATIATDSNAFLRQSGKTDVAEARGQNTRSKGAGKK